MGKIGLVDHTIMEKLDEVERGFQQVDRKFIVVGLEPHQSVPAHPQAARTAGSSSPVPEGMDG